MKRRQYLIGAGSLAAGAAGVVGSGAFTSVDADRAMTVAVADDADALLSIQGTGGGTADYVTADGTEGTLEIDLTDENGQLLGDGVNGDALTVIDDLFTVTNRGTQRVKLTGTKTGPYPDRVIFGVNGATGGFTSRDVFHTFDPNAPTGIPSDILYKGDQPAGNGSRRLPVGNTHYVSLLINTRGLSGGDVSTLIDSVSIQADAV